MQTKQLYYVVEVAKTGSYYKAAKNLFITHQSIRESIKNLEKELSIQLFDHTPRGTVLTDHGKIYLEAFKEILTIYEKAKDHSLLPNEPYSNIITLNMGVNRQAKKMITQYYQELSQNFSDTLFYLVENDNSLSLAHQVFNSELDLAICIYHPQLSPKLTQDHLVFEFLFPQTLLFQVNQNHPLLDKVATVEDILSYPLIDFMNGSGVSILKELSMRSTQKSSHIQSIVTSDVPLLQKYVTSYNAICFNSTTNIDTITSTFMPGMLTLQTKDKIVLQFGIFYRNDTAKLSMVKKYIQFIKNKYLASST